VVSENLVKYLCCVYSCSIVGASPTANISKKNDSFGLVKTISSYNSDTTGTSELFGATLACVPGGYNLIPWVTYDIDSGGQTTR
jgi:hypothetical protein